MLPEGQADVEKLAEGGPFTCIEKIEKSGILSVVMPEDMELSGLGINSDTQVSSRNLNTGEEHFLSGKERTDRRRDCCSMNIY